MVIIAEVLIEAIFLHRDNRFVGTIQIRNQIEKCHIMNPGRMIRFLVPGAKVLVEDRSKPSRKLKYSLLYVVLPHTLILIDSQVPNQIVFEGLVAKKISEFKEIQSIEREVPYGLNMRSRIDFLLDKHKYLEVKATNYIKQGIGYFPDAPTLRGQKHLKELIELQINTPNVETFVLFLSQRTDIKKISPFQKIDPQFTHLLIKAREVGIHLLAYQIIFLNGGKEAIIGKRIPVELPEL